MPRFLIIFFFFLTHSVSFGQGNILKDADAFYNIHQYHKALNSYIAYNRSKPGTEHVLTRIGICYYQTNNTTDAKKSLNAVVGLSKKPNVTAYLYLAKTHHADSEFEEASNHYKT